jgi:acyl-CoA thioesterase FadM
LQRARFWCGFRITRPADEAVIAECRQTVAMVQMPAGKAVRLPKDWNKYRADPSR